MWPVVVLAGRLSQTLQRDFGDTPQTRDYHQRYVTAVRQRRLSAPPRPRRRRSWSRAAMTTDETLSPRQTARITAYLDMEAPPPVPTAHLVFGTNQPIPARLVADRYLQGLAPLIILTGGVNRHNGVVEAREHRRILAEHGVPETIIGLEDTSLSTIGNVEQALPMVREAVASGLEVTAVVKWYHRRALQALRTLAPEAPRSYAVTWEPVYGGAAVTRADWWLGSEVGAKRVLREWRAVAELLAAGRLKEIERVDGAWR
jgi:uncharacterized SAM-binding protein YcdF (DUF218 family)